MTNTGYHGHQCATHLSGDAIYSPCRTNRPVPPPPSGHIGGGPAVRLTPPPSSPPSPAASASHLVTVSGQLGDVLEVVVSDLLQAAQQVGLRVRLVRVGQRPLGLVEVFAALHVVERSDLHVSE